MHESTSRRLCRAAFWLVCVLPTALVLGWCHWQRQPARIAEAEAQLTALTGLAAQVASVSRPRPGVVRLSNVQLNEPESGALVARCERLEIRRFRHLVKVAITGPRLEADRLAALWPAIDRRMQQWRAGWPTVTVQCPEVAVRSKHGKLTLRASDCDLAGLRFADDEVQGWLAFRVAELDNAGRVTLWARRKKRASRPATRFELTSVEASLPAWLLADGCPPLGQIDPQARLRGKVAATHTPAGWDADLAKVELHGKELHRALSAKLPAFGPVSLRVHLAVASLRAGRIVVADGYLSGGPSKTTAAALLRAQRELGLVSSAAASHPAAEIEFTELNARFRLDHEGLRLEGRCGKPGSGVVLRSLRGPLLMSKPQARLPASGLVAVFPAHTKGSVPTGTAAEGLLPLLPTALFEVSARQFEQDDSKTR